MARPAISLAQEFASHTRYLLATATKMEHLLTSGVVVRRDVEQVYLGLYLDVYTSLEQMIEDLFIGLLVQSIYCQTTIVVPRVSLRSSRVARDIVNGERDYVDWLPYHHTKDRAEAFFRSGMPFTSLDTAAKYQLNVFGVIRNAIAHKSNKARVIFERSLIIGTPLMPREKTPAGYLRSQFRAAPVETRFQHLISEMISIATRLCT